MAVSGVGYTPSKLGEDVSVSGEKPTVRYLPD